MTSSERYPGGTVRKAWPLAVSLAAHLVLVLAWLHFGGKERVPDDTPRALSVLLLPKPQQAPPPVLAPERETPAKSNRARKSAAATLRASPVAPSQPAQPSPSLPAPVPASLKPSAWDILNAAKQDIRKGSGEARPGKLGVPVQGDSKWDRFEDRVASAHIDRSPGPVTESYTAPDGLTYYRTRVGGKVVCTKTGSTGPPAPWRSEADIRAGAGSMATLGVGNSAGTTLCPGGKRDWVRN
jgi:hypothetical protein